MKLVCMPLVAGVLATASFADIYVWESFSDPSGGVNAPTGGNGSGDPSVVVVDGAPIVAGSGNLYSPSGAFTMHLYGAGFVNNPTMEIESLGSPFDVSTFYVMTQAGPVFPTVDVTSGGSGFGAFNTYSLSWDYQGPAIFFNFGSLAAHSSLDRLTIGTFGETIPAPGALALLGLAGLGRRRRS
ncbi:MAG: MYXO-CTERM sorting domain-containing protein [Planctomycetota bacterium]|nr:hypothetical protein [Phycisphaerales bacterium]MDP7400337.1 MYXO-CTERM sorting domain-containing protein [Phycisphaerales bacterium]MEE2660732.1 MYXO-CTERM sorting domain-containing protein [Planctomycetota bacterium]